jgi:hypothetical protein
MQNADEPPRRQDAKFGKYAKKLIGFGRHPQE